MQWSTLEAKGFYLFMLVFYLLMGLRVLLVELLRSALQ